jgi:S-adenosylmethionine synthetase
MGASEPQNKLIHNAETQQTTPEHVTKINMFVEEHFHFQNLIRTFHLNLCLKIYTKVCKYYRPNRHQRLDVAIH